MHLADLAQVHAHGVIEAVLLLERYRLLLGVELFDLGAVGSVAPGVRRYRAVAACAGDDDRIGQTREGVAEDAVRSVRDQTGGSLRCVAVRDDRFSAMPARHSPPRGA